MEEIHRLRTSKSSKQTGETYLKSLSFYREKIKKKKLRITGREKAKEPMNNYFL